jgi:hypothetical protein
MKQNISTILISIIVGLLAVIGLAIFISGVWVAGKQYGQTPDTGPAALIGWASKFNLVLLANLTAVLGITVSKSSVNRTSLAEGFKTFVFEGNKPVSWAQVVACIFYILGLALACYFTFIDNEHSGKPVTPLTIINDLTNTLGLIIAASLGLVLGVKS